MFENMMLERRQDLPEVPRQEHYPPYIATGEQRRRWDLSAAIARELFGDVDEANVWQATRAIYKAPWPTDEPLPAPTNSGSRSEP